MRHPACDTCLAEVADHLVARLARHPGETTVWLTATWSSWGRHLAPVDQSRIATAVLSVLPVTQADGVAALERLWSVTPLSLGCVIEPTFNVTRLTDLDDKLRERLDAWACGQPRWGPRTPARITDAGGLYAIDLVRILLRPLPMSVDAWMSLFERWHTTGALECWTRVLEREAERWGDAWVATDGRQIVRRLLLHQSSSMRSFGVRCASIVFGTRRALDPLSTDPILGVQSLPPTGPIPTRDGLQQDLG